MLCSILWFNSSKGSVSKGGAVVRALAFHQCGPGSNPGINALRCMWVEFVAGSLLCSKRFFSRYFGFPLSSYKTNISKIQFNQEWETKNQCHYMLLLNRYLFHYFIVYCFVCHKLYKAKKSNYLNSHGEEAQEKPLGL